MQHLPPPLPPLSLQKKTFSGRGKTVAPIITSILAVAGFGFGGYGFYRNTKISGTGTADSNSAGIISFSLEVTNPDGSVAGLETDQFTIENGVL